jgi:hypothetical protein
MGLLDDAIREHLELKRLRGADPELVARGEHEAFGPVRGDEPTGTDDDEVALADLLEADDDSSVEDDSTQESQPNDNDRDFSNVGQETAELDMRSVLGEVSSHDVDTAGPISVGQARGRPAAEDAHPEEGTADDSLEWQMSGDDELEGSVMGDGHAGIQDRQDEPAEDVLEETPDFLRDTPEQERLWFEQRPPRDFDFDK